MTGNQGRWPKIDQDGGIEDVTLLILEWLGEQGVNAMIRIDAERVACVLMGGLCSNACPQPCPSCVRPGCRFRFDPRLRSPLASILTLVSASQRFLRTG